MQGARRYLPNGRALAIACGCIFLAVSAYAAALETSIFAVRSIVIVGGTPRVQGELRQALAHELGKSLLRIRSGAINRRVAAIPDLVGVSYDRQFPHTLRVRVSAERAVLLVRRGSDTWLVSARARVMQQLRTPKLSSLPRLWVPKQTSIIVGSTLTAADGALAASALAPVTRHTFPSSVRFVRASGSELTLVLDSGLEVRLGDLGDLRLKLAIAKRILAAVGAGSGTYGYLDVSVPERPVVKALNTQVSSGA